jgi:hypothetical protein
LCGSELVSTHVLLQHALVQQSGPPAQAFPIVVQHAPPMQSWVLRQDVVQLPQWVGLVLVFTQAPPQLVGVLFGQHTPLEQTVPPGHMVPQWPQLLLSPRVPLAHLQLPLWQIWPFVHTVPQVPQLLLSPSVPLAQAQLPLSQVWPLVHGLPQAPQLLVVFRAVSQPSVCLLSLQSP